MPELALNDVHRHALAGELDRVRVAQLMRREPATDPGLSSELAQLTTSSGRRPPPTAGGSVDHAEQRSDRERYAMGHPGRELLEAELVHPGLAALVAFAVTDQQRPSGRVDVGLVERSDSLIRRPARDSTVINARMRRP